VYAGDMYAALQNADALLIVTEWPEFRSPDMEAVGKGLKQKVIFDGRNIFDYQDMKKAGYAYYCIGINTHSTQAKQQ
jgi:UDPglucose 6-dehydrogenase